MAPLIFIIVLSVLDVMRINIIIITIDQSVKFFVLLNVSLKHEVVGVFLFFKCCKNIRQQVYKYV